MVSVSRGIRLAAAVFALTAFASACGDEDDVAEQTPPTTGSKGAQQERNNLPTEYTGEFPQIRQGEPGSGGNVVLGSILKAHDGTTADLELSFTDSPPEDGGTVTCGGKTYNAKAKIDQSRTAKGSVTITRVGKLDLDIERNIAVVTSDGPPVCDEWAGKWTGSGDLAGRSGTFEFVGFHEDDTPDGNLTLKER